MIDQETEVKRRAPVVAKTSESEQAQPTEMINDVIGKTGVALFYGVLFGLSFWNVVRVAIRLATRL